jgi:hypothetical protein
MNRKISVFEDVTKETINMFFKKDISKTKNKYFSFYFDEEKSLEFENYKGSIKYTNFDNISDNIYEYILNLMIIKYDFSIDIIKKYVLIVKNIDRYDIDILNLIFKSIDLQYTIIKLKCNSTDIFENQCDLDSYILENIHYNMDDYINILSNYYSNKEHKNILMNIFVMVYNYCIYYSIEKIKNVVYIK